MKLVKMFSLKVKTQCLRRAAFSYSLILLFSCPAIGAVDNALVQRAEKYLNNITGLSGDFTQTAGGQKDKGSFTMLRPGRVRLDYKTTPIQLISNGKDLYFYDKSLDQITTVPLTATPAGILVRKNINLTTADIGVKETRAGKDDFSLSLFIRGQEGIGSMDMDFYAQPVRLKSWLVKDATGAATKVVFGDIETKTDFPKNWFELQRHKTTATTSGDSYYE
ncbi:MAG: outer membrane lipoprotein carrier protein LolA [Rickettsiales bacterium]|jgi:outer membrane lipoprotein-sorting protein|nr:outer membrane lipoprotein carrier protein LolA [Rickettsiales bacterium]